MDTPLRSGSVVKIWHSPRGKDYVVLGRKRSDETLVLLPLNCFNSDGTIHKSTLGVLDRGQVPKSVKTVKYADFIEDEKVAERVTRVVGTIPLNTQNRQTISGIAQKIDPSITALQSTHCIFAPAGTVDSRSGVLFQ